MITVARHVLARVAFLLLTCTALIGALLLPAFASQAHAYRAYDVWVDGTQITGINEDDVFEDGTVSFEFDDSTNTGTLTLTDAALRTAHDPTGGSDNACIYSNGCNLVISLAGSSAINVGDHADEVFINGICVNGGNLRIEGSGHLEVLLDTTYCSSDEPNLYGIYVQGMVDIEDAHLIVTLSNETKTTGSQYGIRAQGECTWTNASLEVDSWGACGEGKAIYVNGSLTIDGDSKVFAIVHNLTGNYSYAIAHGIETSDYLLIKGISSTTVWTNDANLVSKAITSNNVVVSENAYLEVDAYNEKGESYGIESPSITVYDNAVLKASGRTQALTSDPTFTNHARGGAFASADYDYYSPPVWNGTTDLGGDSSPYRVVWIPGAPTIKRIAGDYANETAAMISREFRISSGTVILARDDDFADALGATGLAGVYDCPIILTDRTTLSSAAIAEIQRLNPWRVIIVGGPGAMKPQLESDLESIGVPAENIMRVYGENSYDTSLACAKLICADYGWDYEPYTPVYVAMSTNFQDALSISPWAYTDCVPIVLQTWGDTSADRGFTNDAKEFLQGKKITVIGGPGAISDASLSGLSVVDRIYGDTGYDTSNAIAESMFSSGEICSDVVFACGAQPPKGTDALAGSALAGYKYAPILLINGNTAMEAENLTTIAKFYTKHKSEVRNIYVLGGSYVVPDSTFETIATIVNAFDITP